jgi:hypothetical protein
MGSGDVICRKCGTEVICVDCLPWEITVRAPDGTSHSGGFFCSNCMVAFAKLGLCLYPKKRPYEPPRLRRITDPVEIANIHRQWKGVAQDSTGATAPEQKDAIRFALDRLKELENEPSKK